ALTDARLLAHAVECDLCGLHLRLRGLDIGLGRLELAPRLHHTLTCGIARVVEIEPPLAERLLGLTDQGIFRAALVDRHAQRAEYRGVVTVHHAQARRAQPVLGEAALHREAWIERA